jgi:hypothetical protein
MSKKIGVVGRCVAPLAPERISGWRSSLAAIIISAEAEA